MSFFETVMPAWVAYRNASVLIVSSTVATAWAP